ncbi:hypothetical protein SDC9_146151 [bioreactor metagenome]|uniref:Uncharacterized protein n=1 Tax=bioreactor metagenome TaxID=1076179 RepID=A0A645EC96_9ZZZZ
MTDPATHLINSVNITHFCNKQRRFIHFFTRHKFDSVQIHLNLRTICFVFETRDRASDQEILERTLRFTQCIVISIKIYPSRTIVVFNIFRQHKSYFKLSIHDFSRARKEDIRTVIIGKSTCLIIIKRCNGYSFIKYGRREGAVKCRHRVTIQVSNITVDCCNRESSQSILTCS